MVATGITARDRMWAGLGTAIVLALFGYMLLRGLTVSLSLAIEKPMELLDLRTPPPPPPPRPRVEPPKERHAAAASPRNLKGKATPVVVPPPIVPPLVPPPPLIVAPKPNVGAAASTGASDRAGPGQGAGGEGNGTGGGGDGDGDGGMPPRLLKGRLKFGDLPAALRAASVDGAVGVRYHVEVDGHVSDCGVTRSSGHADLDAATCQLIEQRFRYAPSRDEDGHPVRSTIVETHDWVIERESDAGRPDDRSR
jgi:periplasmic protein TonB